MSERPEFVENLVIGGGPAGSLLAMLLAKAGRTVTLLERERLPHHKVCGEFLSREGVAYLRQCGIALSALGAVPIGTVRVSFARKSTEAGLPFEALSLSRFALDEAMLVRAEMLGCDVRRGACVESAEARGEGWSVAIRDGRELIAKNVFLANGKHDLRGWNRTGGGQSDLVGLKMHWRLEPAQTKAIRECMELFLFRGGYGGLALVENEVANLCLVVRRSRLRRVGGWDELLAAILGECGRLREILRGATAMWERPLAISPIPYGYLGGRPGGIWCVGDQACVIPSFTGDGISIALHSAALAAQMHLRGASADEYHTELRGQLRRGMSLAVLLSRAMVTGPGRGVAPIGLAMFPRALGWIAAATRIPKRALCCDAAMPRMDEASRQQNPA